MSDFQKFLKRASKSKAVKQAELGEKSEGLRDALVVGHGDAVTGGKKLHYAKPGLAAAEAKAKRPVKPAKEKKR